MTLRPAFAWTLALGCVGWQFVARVGQMFDTMSYLSIWSARTAVVGALAIAGLLAAQALVTVGRGPQRLLLALMVVLVFAPAPLVGAAWPMVCGVLGAAILLTVRAPLSWLLCIVAALADGVIGWSLSDQGDVIFTSRLYVSTTVAVTLFAVARLARLIQAADDARIEAARAEADAERLRSAERLRTAVGPQLSRLIQYARDASTAAAPSPHDIAHVARLARQASADARRAVDGLVRLRVPRLPARVGPADDYRLAWWASILIVIAFAGIAINNVIWAGAATTGTWAAVIVTVIVSGVFHLYHGTPRADGGSPRWWPLTLSAHVVMLTIVIVTVGESLFLFLILVAGTLVTRVRAPWSWFALVVVAGGYLSLTYLTMTLWSVWTSVYFAGTLAIGVITVYALCNLPGVAKRLHETRADLARTAVVTERLRFARDVHDLLGFHLAAISVTSELAARTIDTDPDAARARLVDVRHSAERALADVRSINDSAGEIVAADELAAARSMLEAAGVRVTIDSPAGRFGDVDHLVGVIVREAVTNVVRHARAGSCAIRVSARDSDTVHVSIANDGADDAPTSIEPSGGLGIASLTARVAATGGTLTTDRDGSLFTLEAHLRSAHTVMQLARSSECARHYLPRSCAASVRA